MCGGGGGGDGGAAEREQARQRNISAGLQKINRVFDGYQQGIDPLTDGPELDASYFLNDGTAVKYGQRQVTNPAFNAWSTRMGPNGRLNNGYGYQTPAPEQFIMENYLSSLEGGKDLGAYTGKRDLFSGSQQVGGFTDDFFNEREQAYLDYANPQLEDQFAKAKEELLFSLARNGRLNSQTRAERLAELQKDFDLQRTNINDKALGVANSSRADIERARSDLVMQNNSLQNPSAVADLASQRAKALSQQPQFDPLGSLFQNTTAGLATSQQADQKRRDLQSVNNLFLVNDRGGGSARTVNG